MRTLSTTITAAFLLLAGCASADQAPPTEEPADEAAAPADDAAAEAADAEAPAGDTIAALASSREDLSTLVTALDAAGLVETMNGEGPFTVFAPTNDAFAALPEGALDSLLADKDALTGVLTYHVVSGAVMSEAVVGMSSADTLAGAAVAVDASDGVKVGGATVIEADIKASNGVIHIIDAVMMPPG